MTAPVPDCTNSPLPAPPQARQPAGDFPARPAAVSPDPAQQARRALLWYLATATPMPHPGMPNHADIPDVDLARILSGLVTVQPLSFAWDDVRTHAADLAAYLAAGGAANPTGQGYLERLLLDAINSCAPDRGPE